MKLFLITTSLIKLMILASSIITLNEAIDIDDITCEKESFNIKKLDLSNLIELEQTYVLQLSLKKETLEIDVKDYVDACMDYVIVNGVRADNSEKVVEKKVQIDKTNYNLIKVELTLEPLKAYTFKIGYKQKNDEKIVYLLNDDKVHSCFGKPGKVENVQIVANADTAQITWDEPVNKGAPIMSYYQTERSFSNGTIYDKKITNIDNLLKSKFNIVTIKC